jgi:hypothetical protein
LDPECLNRDQEEKESLVVPVADMTVSSRTNAVVEETRALTCQHATVALFLLSAVGSIIYYTETGELVDPSPRPRRHSSSRGTPPAITFGHSHNQAPLSGDSLHFRSLAFDAIISNYLLLWRGHLTLRISLRTADRRRPNVVSRSLKLCHPRYQTAQIP